MRREVTVTLTRDRRVRGRQRKVTKRVVVVSLTIRRFLKLLHICARRACATSLKMDNKAGPQDWIRALSPKDFCDLADLACPREPPRWYKGWASVANTWRLMDGMLDTNEVGRLLQAVNLNPSTERAGTIDGDIASMAKTFGISPPEVLSWYADEFLDAVKGLNDLTQTQEPERQRPDPLGLIGMMPGIGVVH